MGNYTKQLRTVCSLVSEPSVADILFVEFPWKPNMVREKLLMCAVRENPIFIEHYMVWGMLESKEIFVTNIMYFKIKKKYMIS